MKVRERMVPYAARQQQLRQARGGLAVCLSVWQAGSGRPVVYASYAIARWLLPVCGAFCLLAS